MCKFTLFLLDSNVIVSPPRTCCREELNRKDVELKSKGVITSVEAQRALVVGGGVGDNHVTTEGGGGAAVLGAQRIAQLEARLKSAMVRRAAPHLFNRCAALCALMLFIDTRSAVYRFF